MRNRVVLCLITSCLFAAPHSLHAQSIALRYWLTPLAESGPAAEQALADFMEWLRQEGDTRRWSVYRVVLGDDLGDWVLRSGGHSWDELDGRRQGFSPAAFEKFQAGVIPAFESVTLQIEQGSENLTRRAPSGGSTSLYHITEWRIEPGGVPAFDDAVGAMMDSHDQAGVPFYSNYYDVMGSGTPTKRRSRNYSDWASFASAPRFGSTLETTYGPDRAAEIRTSYRTWVQSVKNFVLEAVPALGVPGGEE